jgi:hypothetical protein
MLPIDTHSAATAIGLANSAFSSVKTALDLAKKTADRDLKSEIGSALDNVLELKVKIYELAEENRSLREQLTLKAKVARNSEFGYYFAEGDPDPLCPKCYEASGKSIHLPASKPWSGGVRRDCIECRQTFWEKNMVAKAKRVIRTPNNWMG